MFWKLYREIRFLPAADGKSPPESWFTEFEFRGCYSALLAEQVEALWHFHAKVDQCGVAWDDFYFSSDRGSNPHAARVSIPPVRGQVCLDGNSTALQKKLGIC